MEDRFIVRDFVNAVTMHTSYRVIDTADPGSPVSLEAFGDKAVAEAARAFMTKNQLNLGDGWNRPLLRLQGALTTDSDGMEIFVGLNRAESEKYSMIIPNSEPDNDLLDMQHRHREAITGYKVDPA